MSGLASPRNYGMYSVAEAQFWKQRVARETAALNQSEEITQMIAETQHKIQCASSTWVTVAHEHNA